MKIEVHSEEVEKTNYVPSRDDPFIKEFTENWYEEQGKFYYEKNQITDAQRWKLFRIKMLLIFSIIWLVLLLFMVISILL